MKTEELHAACRLLGEVAENLRALPEEQTEAVTAALQFEIVRLYLMDLAVQLNSGTDPYDALVKTVAGDTQLSALGIRDETLTTMQLLASKPKD